MVAYLIIDGQWGSSGKGLVAGYLARRRSPDVVVCNFGPNAGHTFVDCYGNKYVTKMLPTGGVASGRPLTMLIGPGAVVDPTVLKQEIEMYGHALANKRLHIHEHAAVVRQHNIDEEVISLGRIASTQRGTASAMCDKIMRKDGAIAGECPDLSQWVVSHSEYSRILDEATIIQVESAQGFDLSLSSGHKYPHVTGREVTPAQILSDVALPISELTQTIMVVRTFPIRVGNFGSHSSGPCHEDQEELSWSDIGVEPELTTVTRRVRRVFSWSREQFLAAARAVRPDYVFINFMNYLPVERRARFVEEVNKDLLRYRARVRWLGYGPSEDSVEEVV